MAAITASSGIGYMFNGLRIAMMKSIVITGASKGIGRATADALVEQGWSVIGVARTSPETFPGEFIRTDLADVNQTRALATDLAARAETCLESSTMWALRGMRRLMPSSSGGSPR